MNYFFDKDDPFIIGLREHVARMDNDIPDDVYPVYQNGIPPWNKGKKCDYMSQAMKKTYTVIHPNGTVETVVGMKEFCEKHNLSKSNMSQVATGKQKHHKGYRIL